MLKGNNLFGAALAVILFAARWSPCRGKGATGATSGNIECPCFCGKRDDETTSVFWVNQFGFAEDETFKRIEGGFQLKTGERVVDYAPPANGSSFSFDVGQWIFFPQKYWPRDPNQVCTSTEDEVCDTGTKMDILYGDGDGLLPRNLFYRVDAVTSKAVTGKKEVTLSRPWVGDPALGVPMKGLECGTSCMEPAGEVKQALGVCAPYVDYKFCVRKMNDTTAVASISEHIKSLSSMASTCVTESVFQKYFGDPDTTSDTCLKTVLKTSCYMLYPRCDSRNNPLPVCSASCENEMLECRTRGSGFGHKDQIRQVCSNYPWSGTGVDPELCTGTGARTFASSSSNVAIVAAIALAAFQLIN